MEISILFVEDDDRLLPILKEAAAMDGYKADGAANAEEALERLSKKNYDIVVTDISLPGMSGLDMLPRILQMRPGIVTIVITGHSTIENAVEAMKRGATDFLTKPFELDTLSSIIRVAAERVFRNAFSVGGKGVASVPVVKESAAMQKVFEHVSAIAPFNTTVLITGETGTGKELAARAIHQQSTRSHRPMISLNCAAVPENLLEDELFGHVKGAFTGAHSAREGRFEMADGGTLFLDEVGDMSLPLQSKLLRVLQEREFEKLGSSRTIKVDVRIIAATSADLDERIRAGSFRPDLLYRLNVVHLRIPPLRSRKDDIEPLARELLKRFCDSTGLPPKQLAGETLTTLQSYSWPGNVRQLQNAMERAAALSGVRTLIEPDDLPEEVRGGPPYGIDLRGAGAQITEPTLPSEGVSFEAVVSRVERELLLQSLKKAGGNKMQAAKLLNMKRTTFVEKLKRLQIESEEDKDGDSG